MTKFIILLVCRICENTITTQDSLDTLCGEERIVSSITHHAFDLYVTTL